MSKIRSFEISSSDRFPLNVKKILTTSCQTTNLILYSETLKAFIVYKHYLILKIHPKIIKGAWRYGEALDLHTLSSVPRNDGNFDTTRTEIGEALYQLKYQFDRSKIEPIAEVVAQRIMSWRVFPYLKALIPIPPSKLDRPFQPVLELAKAIGNKTNLPLPNDYLFKVKQTQALKEIESPELRQQEIQDAFQVSDQRYLKESVLLFDDLFRSGETLNAVSKTLLSQGNVGRLYVLTVTMTRRKR